MHDKRRLMIATALAAMTGITTQAAAQIPNRTPPAPVRPSVPAPAASPSQEVQPAQALPASTPGGVSAPAGYTIGVDDVIEADVLGQADFKTRARVRADGTVPLPYLGAVPVQGETAVSLAEKLAKLLRAGGYYAKPIVNVEIITFVSNYVTVLGEVNSAGLQPIDRAYRVSEIIARAGGLRATGAESVVLTRADGSSTKLDYTKLAQGGPNEDPEVKAGDKIFVPEAEKFYIYGQVNAPGVYAIRDEMTLRRALAQGGGLTPAGSSKRVKISRNGQEIKLKMDDPIKPGDVVVVGERLF
ncbi:SLBB domain-containing protein [Sphingomonas sp. HT-1]|uniref:SLBB domain-containing protein n=1 Tax=unclassified Sphingomonas TaxID=196159 RepID=UPI000378B42F|nr:MULTISPECIES: SLBB domain-containing protein [unclassified Sphingomonas]KTF67437.1 polysaccharide transporter [Sphingomonas sp. WG]